MTPEQMSNEELADATRLFRDAMLDSGGRSWTLHVPARMSDPDIMLTEIETRLRNSIPKPVVEILEELRKAATKFPSWPTDPFHALAIVGEEFGELQQSFLKTNYEGATEADRKEAIQLAAMAIRFLIHWEDYYVPKKLLTKTALGLEGGDDE